MDAEAARAGAGERASERALGRGGGRRARSMDARGRERSVTMSAREWMLTRSDFSSQVVTSAVFDALKFDPERVSVSFDATSTQVEPESLLQRRYTLTHNDVTRNLTLTVGDAFNDDQTSIWYTKLLRDEVLAEWREDGLHVFCQVSAKEAWWIRWAAPLRAVVFRQKLPLVLDTLRYAERELLSNYPELFDSPVYVNFGEANGPGDKEYWGDLRSAGTEETKAKRVLCADGAGLDPRIAENVRKTITGPRGSRVDIGGVVLESKSSSPAPPR